MPKNSSYRKKGRKFRKKNKTMSKKLAKLSQLVYKTIEPKQVTNFFDTDVGSTAWTAISLTDFQFNNQAGQGTTNQQRVGNSIMLSSISLRMNFSQLSNFYSLRCLVVQFPQKAGAPTAADPARFLTYGQAQSNAANRWLCTSSPYAIGSPLKYTILNDFIINAQDLSVDTPNQNYAIQHKKNIYIKPKQKVLEFQLTSQSGVQSIPNKGQINLYMINDYPDLAGGYNTPVQGIIRIKFRDS